MFNVTTKLTGKVLTITVDTSKVLGPSASGKSEIIASTQGNALLEGGIKLGLNVYRPVAASDGK